MLRKTALVVFLLVSSPLLAASDRDDDGVPDALEEALLERFRPAFLLDAQECAEAPAEFQAFSVTPRVRARSGTIYARASPSDVLGPRVFALELHYYHLWDRDCGPVNGHPLDVEHVSALVVATGSREDAGGFQARYWYAAAHEGTICDASHAALAGAIGASDRGPRVYVSWGKHASFLSYALCNRRGCGGDRCGEMVPLPKGSLVNLGEAHAPLGGAVWIQAPEWPLSRKLGSDFDPKLVAALDRAKVPVLARVNGQLRPVQFTVSIGGDLLAAFDTAGEHAAGAVSEAEEHTGSVLGRTVRAVGRALARVARSLGLAEP